jgi:Flp pilus assembly protein CpaB
MRSPGARARRRHMLVAAVAALMLTALLMWGFALAKSGLISSSATGSVPQTQVVAVTKDLPVNATIATGDLKFTSIPTSQVNAENVQTFASVIGQLTTVHLTPNSVLLHSDLTGLPTNPYAVKLPSGHLAVSIPFDEKPDFGGYVQPGDHIDIICSNGDGTTSFCFTDVLVIQVGGKSQQPTPDAGSGPINLGNGQPGAPSPAPVISGAVLLVVDMTHADALAVEADLEARGEVVGYALVSAADASPS